MKLQVNKHLYYQDEIANFRNFIFSCISSLLAFQETGNGLRYILTYSKSILEYYLNNKILAYLTTS